ncbi:MAG: phenylalanine--tRNA ligase subunit alpha [Anaerolineaceae bacterium]
MTERPIQPDDLDALKDEALEALGRLLTDADLSAWKTRFLGRSSALMQAFSQIPNLPAGIRPAMGKRANQVKQAIEAAFTHHLEQIERARVAHALENENLDVTLPGRKPRAGRLHPQTQTLREICRIFGDMGFQVYRSREVESDEFNFELLNIPAHHPARDLWDTYHVNIPGAVLRTHTSPGQIRYMREHAPEPIRVILPGMVYRYEQVTARAETQFNQVELLVVGKQVTFADLKGTLLDFARRMFGEQVRTRIRPSYFPFTEPSGEMDVECFICGGTGCKVCKNTGWLEILGCGMVHPTVLQNGGYDPEVYSGFAAGMGPERISMLRNRISDIRYFWSNDIRFLEQFS